MLFKASAPGTLMLMGEHAVLRDKQAIVSAIDKRINVCLTPRFDQKVVIISSLGKIERNLDNIVIEKPLQFVYASILSLREKLTQGFELTIHSEFSNELGLGSSAAVTVATLAVLLQWIEPAALSIEDFKSKLLLLAKTVIQAVQGIGSGADVAASIYGGILLYQQNPPFVLKQFSASLPLVVVYSGFKTPTVQVVKQVDALREKNKTIFLALEEAMHECVREADLAIEGQDWGRLGELWKIQQGVMQAFGVSTDLLDELISCLNTEPGIYGAKISGSGLGDCVIGLGDRSVLNLPNIMNIKHIPLSVCREGVLCE